MAQKFVLFILLFSWTALVSAQNRTVSGSVFDEQKNPVIGASVVVKGTTKGTTSDLNGAFKLVVSPEDKTLRVSYLGMTTQDIPLTNETEYRIYLAEDVSLLDEVVVVGYGTVKKSDLTGSIESIKADKIISGPSASVSQMMAGRVPGLYINSANQDPGSDPAIILRGVGSLSGSSTPLVVIDGFPTNSASALKALNPNDVEQIDVLKDASATAIYGSRGANGVIIVTTKRGQKNEKVAIDYSAKFSTEKLAKKVDVLNADEYIRFYYDLANDADFALPLMNGYDGKKYPHPLEDLGTTPDTDWQTELTNESRMTQEHSISLSGGSGDISYRISANYYNGKSIVGPSEFTRFNTASNIVYKKDRLYFSVDFLYNREDVNSVKNDFIMGLKFAPTVSKYDENGELGQWPVSSMYWILNPFNNQEHKEDFGQYNRTRFNYNLSYEILKGLKLEGRAGYEVNSNETFYYNDATLYQDDQGGLGKSGSKNLNIDGILSYGNSFGKHHISAMAATNYQFYQSRGASMSGDGFSSPYIKYYDMNAVVEKLRRNMSSNWSEQTLQAFLARANYNYDNRYYLTVNYRIDGATQFGDNNKIGHFPSVALAWRINNEKFFHSDYINNLKLKFGYGLSGNSNVPSGRSQALLEYIPVYMGDKILNGVRLRGGYYPNPDLRWEGTRTTNAGVELGTKHFTANVDVYRKHSFDLLLDRLLPQESGYEKIMVNKGEMMNYGLEARVDGYLSFFGGQLQWNPSVWGAYNHNRIINFDGSKVLNMAIRDDDRNHGYAGIMQEGYPMGAIFGYDYDGVWQISEADEAAKYNAKPGDPKFRDSKTSKNLGTPEEEILDGPDGKIDDADKRYLGSYIPSLTAGFSNTFRYKQWSLNFMFDGVFNKKVVNYTRLYMFPADMNTIHYGNVSKEAMYRWTPDRPDTDIPSFTRPQDQRMATSTFCITDASFVRLRELTLGYQWDFKDNKYLRGARVYVTGTNLLTFTDYLGLNPDAWGGIDSKSSLGAIPKLYTLGINLMF